MSIGTRVQTDIDIPGTIINIRFDNRGDRLITVALDSSATPDGLYIARDFEITEIAEAA